MKPLLTSAEAGEILRATPRQVTILCARGDLRATKLGGEWRIAEEDVRDFVDTLANRTRRQRRRRAA